MVLGPVLVGGQPSDQFIELARTQKGRLFRKNILKYGKMSHPNVPGEYLEINEQVADRLIENFEKGVCPIVQVPVVGKDNQHTEDPRDNIGEILGIEKTKTGVDVILDARKNADDIGNTLIGASAMMHLDYTDTKTGEKVGPTLLHVAVTNRPYVTDLEDFQEVIAASADIDSEKDLVLFSPQPDKESSQMTKDQMIAALKKDHDVDVEALLKAQSEQPDNPDQTSPNETPEDAPKPVTEEEAPQQDDPTKDAPTTEEPNPVPEQKELVQALSAVLKAASTNSVTLSAKPEDQLTVKDIADAVIEVAQNNVALSNTVSELQTETNKLRTERATQEVDGLVQQGRILPAQRDIMLKLSMEQRETFEALLPDTALVSLSEDGVTTHEDMPSEKAKHFAEEAERLAALAKNV